MKDMKKDNPKITFRPDEVTKKRFRDKCFYMGLSQDSVLINLIKKWIAKK